MTEQQEKTLKEYQARIRSERRGIDISPPLKALIPNPVIKKKTDPSYLPVDIIGINISVYDEYMYLIENEKGTRKYLPEKSLRFV